MYNQKIRNPITGKMEDQFTFDFEPKGKPNYSLPDYHPKRKKGIENKYIDGTKKEIIDYLDENQYYRIAIKDNSEIRSKKMVQGQIINYMLYFHLGIKEDRSINFIPHQDLNTVDYKDYNILKAIDILPEIDNRNKNTGVVFRNILTDNNVNSYGYRLNKRITI
jgi:hypothetical protein